MQTERTRSAQARKGKRLFFVLLLICALLAAGGFLGGTLFAPDYIAVLDINGSISTNDGASYDQQYLLDSIAEITDDTHNAALLLHIDSPGGTVYHTDELYRALEDYKTRTGRPVYAAVESYAASGGYYAACAADAIYANPNAITGSIGVYFGEFVDVSGLLDRLGIDVSFVVSGSNKTMGSSYEPLTDEQRAIYQSIIDEYYARFVNVVAESRGMDEATVRALADGRIYSASQAVANGLIDGVEYYDETVQRLKDALGRDDVELQYYSYSAPLGFWDFFSNLMQGGLSAQKSDNALAEALQDLGDAPQLLMYYRG